MEIFGITKGMGVDAMGCFPNSDGAPVVIFAVLGLTGRGAASDIGAHIQRDRQRNLSIRPCLYRLADLE